MNDVIVHSETPITLIGGGEAEITDLQAVLALAPTCVAADGGLALALAAGVSPVAVIGDLDSVAPSDLDQVSKDRRFPIREQNSGDFDKSLRNIAAPLVLAVGFLGGRLDHQMAALHVLVSRPERSCILVGRTEIVFLCPPALAIPTQSGDTVSLFPMGAVTGRSDGLEWPIGGLTFDPMSQIGTSNRATGALSLVMDAPKMLVMVPRVRLQALTRALATAPPAERWSAP